jgi:hypothetical protein
MLESSKLSEYYPKLCDRKLGKYGFAKGWRVDTLRCANGFNVVGLGLDAAVRGIKVEEARPDLLILDDIDSADDSIRTVNKKVNTLTTSVLPAGSTDAAILGVQNLIHGNSIFTQIAEGTADFLYERVVSGPHPAIEGLEYEARPRGGYRITSGEPTWEGQGLEVCERQINDWGLRAFLREAQHNLEQRGGAWAHIKFRHVEFDSVPEIVKGSVWVDPAVTSTDESDAMGIQADGLGVDGKLYRFFSWEQITTPEDALERAILKALELGFTTVGVETDQGGDTWKTTYKWVWEHLVADGRVSKSARMPTFESAKAGAGHGSKVARNQRMMTDYERGKIIHVIGTHTTLERALRRFPDKPLDLADASFWSWEHLIGSDYQGGSVGKVRIRGIRREPKPSPQSPRSNPEPTVTLHYKGKRTGPLNAGPYRWMLEPGWTKEVEKSLATQIARRFPDHFDLEE